MKKKPEKTQIVPTKVFKVRIEKVDYSDVKLYIPKDKNGRSLVGSGNNWYVYFYYRNPKNGRNRS